MIVGRNYRWAGYVHANTKTLMRSGVKMLNEYMTATTSCFAFAGVIPTIPYWMLRASNLDRTA